MLFGITGSNSAGKATLVDYLVEKLKFGAIDLKQLFIDQIPKESPENLSSLQELSAQFYSEKSAEIRSLNLKGAIESAKKTWDKFYVIYPLVTPQELDILNGKHFTLSISLEAPLLERYERYKTKYDCSISLEKFAASDDQLNFNEGGNNLSKCISLSILHLKNTSTKEEFYTKLEKYELMSTEVVRPKWERYFMRVSHLVKTRSNCMRRAVGAVLVKNHRIISTGYNGTPFRLLNCYEGGCDRCNNSGAKMGVGLDYCLCIHAEENAIVEAGREKSEGAAIYCTTLPCSNCTKILIQAGIEKVFYDEDYDSPMTLKQLGLAGVTVIQLSPHLLLD